MRKIAIVGATPEAFIQLSLLINNRRYDGKEKYGDDQFTLIHDPDKVYPYMLSGIGVAFQEVLDLITKDAAHIGMVPGFWDNLDGRCWDKFVEVSEENNLKVISVVPIIKRQGATKSLAMIAKQKAEETGDDSSLFAIKARLMNSTTI